MGTATIPKRARGKSQAGAVPDTGAAALRPCPLCTKHHQPNALTRKTLDDSLAGRNVKSFKNLAELFRDLKG
jgi:hypothetical protein